MSVRVNVNRRHIPTGQRDRELLDQVRDLSRDLNHGITVRLALERDDDVYAEGLRELGERMTDIGDALLARAAELD